MKDTIFYRANYIDISLAIVGYGYVNPCTMHFFPIELNKGTIILDVG